MTDESPSLADQEAAPPKRKYNMSNRTRKPYVRTVPPPQQERTSKWKADGNVTYSAAHYRIRKALGKASLRTCDCLRPAMDWCYNHTDPNEMVSPEGRAYSVDPGRYVAMCRACHIAYDRAMHKAPTQYGLCR